MELFIEGQEAPKRRVEIAHVFLPPPPSPFPSSSVTEGEHKKALEEWGSKSYEQKRLFECGVQV